MCADCVRTTVDITEGIPKQIILHFCRNCERYLQPPNQWITAALESRELLALCLKKVKGLNKVRLVDASFIWTEPHSKRIKAKLTIQKEVGSLVARCCMCQNDGASVLTATSSFLLFSPSSCKCALQVFANTILQQAFVIEYVVHSQQCEDCQRVMAQLTWKAVVQVRQKVPHKRTFLYLEQLILKHGAHKETTNIKTVPEGLDFYYGSKSHAIRMCDFLRAVVPLKMKVSEQLISHDIHTSVSNFKFTFSIDIVPICKVRIGPSAVHFFGRIRWWIGC
jgi:nonsense-mediated mRNA decay protein 3